MEQNAYPSEQPHTKSGNGGPRIICVSDPEDPRIAGYREVRERDLTRHDHFVAEGEVVLRVLLASPLCEAVSIMVVEKRRDGLLARLPPGTVGCPVYSVDQAVIDSVVGFPVHRGILALGRRRLAPTATALLDAVGSDAVVIALFGIANHDNIGGIFRNAAAFGAAAVLLDPTCCDPLYRKAIRVSVGGTLVTPFARLAADEDPLALMAARGFRAIALSPAGVEPLARVARGGRVAVLLGSEGPGLPPAILQRSRTVTIPMAAGFDSLNVATTSGIVLHHLMQAS